MIHCINYVSTVLEYSTSKIRKFPHCVYLAVDETRKALDELEARGRPKRDTDPEDMERRLAVLKNSAARFAKMRESVNTIMTKVKTKLKAVRKEISG